MKNTPGRLKIEKKLANVGWKLVQKKFSLQGILLCIQRSMVVGHISGEFTVFPGKRDPRVRTQTETTNFEWPSSAKMEFMLG